MGVNVKRITYNGGLGKLKDSLANKTGKEVAVGFPAGKAQAYPDGTGVAFVAACHVYGFGVPKRDFMGLAGFDIRRKAIPILKLAMKQDSERKMEALMKTAGQVAADAVKKAIVDLDSPPNAPSTIAAKGSENPLIDTGHMLESVTYAVRKRT